MPSLDPEVRFRDMEHRLAEPTITSEPPPLGITLTRFLSPSESLPIAEVVGSVGRGPVYRLGAGNRLRNPVFRADLDGWTLSAGGGVIEQSTVV